MAKGAKGTAKHGGSGRLYNEGCRCDTCKTAHRARMAAARTARRAQLIWKDGYLFHPLVENHNASTYCNWGCRCPECQTGHAERMAVVLGRRRRKLGMTPRDRALCPQCGTQATLLAAGPTGSRMFGHHKTRPNGPICMGSYTFREVETS